MMNMKNNRQRGIGLIEVLVALIVVSFGVLGMAGLQLTGMKHSTNSFNRSKALMLTENIATRMRINNSGVISQAYAGFDSSDDANLCDVRPAPYCQASKGAAAQSCSVEELADFDMHAVSCGDWGASSSNAGVQGLLPEGAKLEIICDDGTCVSSSTYTLRVSWPERKTASSEDDPEMRQVQMRLRP